MRENKFRSKHAKTGVWFYGTSALTERKNPIDTTIPLSIFWVGGTGTLDPKTVGQSTGLHDKNGKEIYEGDILRHSCTPNGDCCAGIYEVAWHDSGFTFKDEHGYTSFIIQQDWQRLIEVIGNIWENPELLATGETSLSKLER